MLKWAVSIEVAQDNMRVEVRSEDVFNRGAIIGLATAVWRDIYIPDVEVIPFHSGD